MPVPEREETGLDEKGAATEARKNPFDESQSEEQLKKLAMRISQRMDKRMKRARDGRWSLEKVWYRNVLYYAGDQWIYCDNTQRRWRKKKLPGWVPDPVTNLVAPAADDNITSLLQQPPSFSFSPETTDPEDIASAKVASRINEVIARETRREKSARRVAAWVVLTGDAFVESYYDNDPKYGEIFIHYQQCQQCGFAASPSEVKDFDEKCPQCGGEEFNDAYETDGTYCAVCTYLGDEEEVGQECPVCLENAMIMAQEQQAEAAMAALSMDGAGDMPMDPMGGMVPPGVDQMGTMGGTQGMAPEPPEVGVMEIKFSDEKIGREAPRGKICQKIRSPFEVYYDHQAVTEFSDSGGLRWVIVLDMIDKEEAAEKYGIDDEEMSSTGSSRAKTQAGRSPRYLQSLAVLGNGSTAEKYGVSTSSDSEMVSRETYYELPSRDFPEGVLAVRINGSSGKIPQMSELIYQRGQGERYIPISHYKFDEQPGRCSGKAAVADIIPLQSTRNKTESLMMLAEQRMTNGVWLVPNNVVDTTPTGMPGEIIRYNIFPDSGGRAPKPERIPGLEPPGYYRYRLQDLDQKINSIAGSFGVAHGEVPAGVTAYAAIQYLGEAQQRSASPQTRNWEMSWEETVRIQMDIFKQFATEGRFEEVQDSNSLWDIEVWSSADLTGNINVRVESGSALPKSHAQERASIETLTNAGAINPADPRQNLEILRSFGMTAMVKNVNVDIDASQKEQAKFLRAYKGRGDGSIPKFRKEIDNHQVHLQEHVSFCKGDEWLEMEELADRAMREQRFDDDALIMVRAFQTHINQHKEALIAEQAAQQQLANPQMGEDAPENQGEHGAEGGRPPGGGQTLDRRVRAPNEEARRQSQMPVAPVQ
jgi:hypothetical protein